MYTGVVDYDPKHRVPAKKEYAIKRRRSREAFGHLAICLPYLKGQKLYQAKELFEHFINNPGQYTQGARVLCNNRLNRLYECLRTLNPQHNRIYKDAFDFWTQIEDSFCKTTTQPWTAILRVSSRLTKPHRLAYKDMGRQLLSPAWGPHVTWVKNEEPLDKDMWNIHANRHISFEMTSEPHQSRKGHLYVHVKSDEISDMRKELGLNPRPPVKLHLTIGKEIK